MFSIFSNREHATVLAALEFYQDCRNQHIISEALLNILTNGCQVEPLTQEETDDLIERINSGKPERELVSYIVDELGALANMHIIMDVKLIGDKIVAPIRAWYDEPYEIPLDRKWIERHG